MTTQVDNLYDLEPAICDLHVVADLAFHILQSMLERPTLEDARGVHFTLSNAEYDRVFFLVGNVQDRAAELKAMFYQAVKAQTCPPVDKSNNGDN